MHVFLVFIAFDIVKTDVKNSSTLLILRRFTAFSITHSRGRGLIRLLSIRHPATAAKCRLVRSHCRLACVRENAPVLLDDLQEELLLVLVLGEGQVELLLQRDASLREVVDDAE